MAIRPTRKGRIAAIVVAGCALPIAGCADNRQNTLHTHSPQAHDIAVLWWWMLGVASVVFLGAAVMLAVGWWRRRKPGLPVVGESEEVNQRLVVAFGIAIPIVVLITLFLVSNVAVIRSTAAPKAGSTKLTIRVVGHDWWWEVDYPAAGAVTANEIHIPAATRVNVLATSGDVIHSLWVPELNRKADLIPGRTNRLLLYAAQPGVYRGQCAELCGLQHANMGLKVIAQPPAQFESWMRAQAAPAPRPASALIRQGQADFMKAPCASCHRIRGTSAVGDIGPDLTHLASRTSLAALATDNSPAGLLRWISDPQHIKPGAKMPDLALSARQFRAIASYLRTLR